MGHRQSAGGSQDQGDGDTILPSNEPGATL
jgi:hypothetical protein